MTFSTTNTVNVLIYLLITITLALLPLSSYAIESYVGSQVCGTCHQKEHKAWSKSHHAYAMQSANEHSMLGDFNNSTFSYAKKTSRFFKKGNEYWVNTENADGEMTDFKISYAFGFKPLQQYLILMPDGRYQALSIAWDSRPKSMGGQRWFHLYPEDSVDFEDPLHWTGPYQNWNSRCADCHTTGWEKNYTIETDQYNSQWFESGVGCESCHGPGKQHVISAEGGFVEGENLHILSSEFDEQGLWLLSNNQPVANRSKNLVDSKQVQLCAACHSRRTPIAQKNNSLPYLDQHIPALLNTDLYHKDGQIMDEVFVAGSFWQSNMFHEGVVCSNCHDSHSGNLKSDLNGTCLQCHAANIYAIEKHHHHSSVSEGAICVNCHMPETTYMQVDPRRDHSIRVPDLSLSKNIKSPNVCSNCHQDKHIDWLISSLNSWDHNEKHKNNSIRKEKFRLLATTRDSNNHAQQAKQKLLTGNFPAIIKGTVLAESTASDQQELSVIVSTLSSHDALERLGAIRSMSRLNSPLIKRYVWPLLEDPIKAVRIEAAKALSILNKAELNVKENNQLQKSINEFFEAQKIMADTAVAWLSIAQVQINRGNIHDAESSYLNAIKLEPFYIPALLNLADLYRATNRDSEGGVLLEQALTKAPEDASANYAKAMFLVRQKQYDEALNFSRRANELRPQNNNFAYTYILLLIELGMHDKAMKEAARVLKEVNSPKQIYQLLINYHQKNGAMSEANKIKQLLNNVN